MLLRGVSTLLLMCCWASRSTETSETAALWVWTPSDSTAEEEGRMLFYFRKVDVFDTTLISAGPKIFLSCRWDSLLLKFISLSLALPPVCVMWLCCFTPRWYLSGRLWADPETWRWVSAADVEQIKSNEDKSLMDLETVWLFLEHHRWDKPHTRTEEISNLTNIFNILKEAWLLNTPT